MCGLKLHESKLKSFRSELKIFKIKFIRKSKIKTCIYDLEISLSDLNFKFLKIIEQMGPLGQLKPIFCTRNCKVHLRLEQ